jgi:hypothetical protein
VEQKFINQFVKVARLNRNRMDEDEWKAKAIYNYKPIFMLDVISVISDRISYDLLIQINIYSMTT